ncbi:MAG: beta strand repeat-containing protein, partial [Limisphaerales bacterium]
MNSALTKVGVAGAIPSGASVLMNSGGTSTVLDFNNVATTLKTISGSGGTVELNGATVTINNPAGEIFGANTQSTISGGNFVKNGSGAITFSIGTGSWNGGVTVNNGTLNVGTANSLGTGKLTMAGGKLASSSTGGRSYTVPVDITADSTFGDATTSGTLTFGTGAFRLVAGDRQITCASDVVLNAALANDGTIRALTKAGNSNLTLSVAATYGGNTTVSAGTLTMGAANGIPNTTLNMSGGTLAMGANNCNINALQFSGVSKAAGTWGSLTSAANHKNSRFTGAGVLTVATGGTSTTSVSSDGSPSTYGSPVTFTVTVTGTGNGSTPSGNVTILDNGTPIATPALSGSGNVATATFGTSTLAAGTHANITATWAGDDNYDLSSSSAFSQTVNPRPVTLSGTRAYDGTTDAAASILSIGNKVGVDDVTVASGTATLASADVGSRAITSVGTLALGGANAGNYTLSGASGSVSITAKALSITANNQTKIKGNAFLFNGTEFTTSGLVSPETIGSVTLISAGADTGADAGTYSIVPTAATGGTFNPGNYSVTYHNGTMTVNDPAHITSSPSSSTINAGNSVVLSVTTTGSPSPTYQWKKGGTDLSNGSYDNAATVSGATTPNLTLTNVRASDSAAYTCVATNSAGSDTSSAATLTVNDPVITQQPVNSTFECGSSNALTVTAIGSTNANGVLTYQWYTPDPSGTAITDATNSVLSFPTASFANAGSYSVVITNGLGSSITSSVVVVTIQDTNGPVISVIGGTSTLQCHVDTYTDLGATAIDSCDGAVAVTTNNPVDVNAAGPYTVTYTATDSHGNTSTATRLVTVQDTIAPVITLLGSPVTTVSCGTP